MTIRNDGLTYSSKGDDTKVYRIVKGPSLKRRVDAGSNDDDDGHDEGRYNESFEGGGKTRGRKAPPPIDGQHDSDDRREEDGNDAGQEAMRELSAGRKRVCAQERGESCNAEDSCGRVVAQRSNCQPC